MQKCYKLLTGLLVVVFGSSCFQGLERGLPSAVVSNVHEKIRDAKMRAFKLALSAMRKSLEATMPGACKCPSDLSCDSSMGLACLAAKRLCIGSVNSPLERVHAWAADALYESISVDLESFRKKHLYPYKEISAEDARANGILSYCCNEVKLLDGIELGRWYSDGWDAPVFQWTGGYWVRLSEVVYRGDFVGTFDNETRTICFDSDPRYYLFSEIEIINSMEELAQKPLSSILVVIADSNGDFDPETVYRVVRVPRLPMQPLSAPRLIGLEPIPHIMRSADGLVVLKPAVAQD